MRRDEDRLAAALTAGRLPAAEGAVLRAMIEEASEAGARKALASLGLQDKRARRDMDELRELLGTWRDVKRSASRTIAVWVVRILLATLMIGMAYRLNLLDLLDR